jgi:hypothetical protein
MIFVLGQHAANAVLDAGATAVIAKGRGRRAAQPQPLVNPLKQQHAAIADDVATVKCRLDNTRPTRPNSTLSSVHFGIGSPGCSLTLDTNDNAPRHGIADLYS